MPIDRIVISVQKATRNIEKPSQKTQGARKLAAASLLLRHTIHLLPIRHKNPLNAWYTICWRIMSVITPSSLFHHEKSFVVNGVHEVKGVATVDWCERMIPIERRQLAPFSE